MRALKEKFIYFIFVIFIFIVLWKMTASLWDAFIPWNYKTDLIGLFVVIPLLAAAAFIIAGVMFKVIKNSRKIEK
ncbi:hypothetical protein ACKA06_00360 [Rossellomorea oryzaecorticis]|uniref:Dolichol phosphate-mannose biosynthesis regulatory protein n=1 Tax=Rossellomorea oryzaecorticis TaxID=1396505 RepID=A0ABW8VL98_9BACI|nr:hypothetical protein KJK41_03455 [Bacillus haikouensis]